MDNLRVGRVEYAAPEGLQQVKDYAHLLPFGPAPGVKVAANLARQTALAQALRNRVREPVDRYFGR